MMTEMADGRVAGDKEWAAQDAAYWRGVARIRNLFTVLAAVFLGVGLVLVGWLGPPVHDGGVARDVACVAVALLMLLSMPFLVLRRALGEPPWDLMQNGLRAVATVVSCQPVGLSIPLVTAAFQGQLQRQSLTLDIRVDGQADGYQAQSCQLIPPSGQGRVNPGERLVVHVDPMEPNRVCIDWQQVASR